MGANQIYMLIRLVLLYVLLGISTYTDLKEQKILNKITLPIIILGLILPFYDGLFARIIFLVILFLLSFLPAFGGGDIKLFMGVVTLRGGSFLIYSFFLSILYIVIYLLIKKKDYLIFLIKKIPMDFMNIKEGNFNAIGSQNKIVYAPFLLLGAITVDLIILLGAI